jgi:maleylpyruvate isomerase
MVHSADIAHGVVFADLPADFSAALRADILAKRGAAGIPAVNGAPAEITAWLAGRSYSGVTTKAGDPVPALTPWL